MSKLFLLLLAASLWGADEDGAALFAARCAQCHKDPPVNRAPLPDALEKMPREAVLAALTNGSMKAQGAEMTEAQRMAVAAWVSRKATAAAHGDGGRCAADVISQSDSTYWNGWGGEESNSRYQAGETPAAWKLRWAFAIPGATAAIGQPAVVGGRLYFGSMDGMVYAVDAATGCWFWKFKARSALRSPIVIGTVGHARHAALFGDTQAWVYAVNVKDGSLVWQLHADEHRLARVTGAPKLSGSRLYVPVSSVEEVAGASPKYECCTFRGSVVAIDIESGKQVWKTYTIAEPPSPGKKNTAGVQQHGPAGAAVWSSPALDVARRTLYLGTGNGYADPPVKTTNAVLALDMDSGAIRWSKQLTEADRWHMGCNAPGEPNCPQNPGPDFDIGAAPILRTLPDGRRVLLVGSKSGVAYGLDPADGRTLWQTRVAEGGMLGGIQWGMAADAGRVYIGVSDVHNPAKAGGVVALRLNNGERLWHAAPVKPACEGKRGCTAAVMAPLTVTDTAVFAASMDGMLRVLDRATGKPVWSFDTNRPFDAVNGKGHGGSISGSGAVLANGMLFVNSGYGILGGMPGNVLLAFTPSN
ncbi:MAG: PQQ-binding-like beta-propeller repeat protein [Bryobacterales bacterium]|nr:PQQ-binding-like beta-propeller repeat protein [Bryobacterales bacterium]